MPIFVGMHLDIGGEMMATRLRGIKIVGIFEGINVGE